MDALLAGTLILPWRVHCAGVMSSAAVPVEIITGCSDTLLIFLLKSRNPKVFGDRLKQEHSGSEGGPIPVIIMPSADE